MTTSAWDAGFGSVQGRIASAAAEAGSYLFALGSAAPNRFETLAIGDFVEVSQADALAGVERVRFTTTLRPPTTMPDGARWRFSLRVDGVEIVGQDIPPGRTRRRVDMSANVANLVGPPHTVAFRLELLGVGDRHDVELPGCFVDALVLETGLDRPTLSNRDPEPSETDTPVNQTISLDIIEVGAGAVELGSVRVYVGGVLAFDGGTFQAGFTGPESSHSNPQADVLRVRIDPLAPFAGGEVVSVLVQANIIASPELSLSESYSFTTEDIVNPQLVSAAATDLRKLRVVFDETMLAASSAGDGDALNPASWLLELAEGDAQTRLPAVTAEVASVEDVDGVSFDLTPDIDLTPDATYQLTAVRIRDIAGNETLPPNDAQSFVAFRPQQDPDREFDLWEMIPQMNRDEDETGDLEKLIRAIQEPLELLLYEIDRFGDILDPLTAPEPFVDAMLYDLGNPFTFDLSLADKRRLVEVLVPIYKLKGTDPGIINAIRFFMGIEVTISVPASTAGKLGVDKLGVTLVLGTSSLRDKLTMLISVPRVLTSEEERRMEELVSFMKRGETHHRIEAPSAPVVPDHWELGRSRLGIESVLH